MIVIGIITAILCLVFIALLIYGWTTKQFPTHNDDLNSQLYFKCLSRPSFRNWDKVYFKDGKLYLDEGYSYRGKPYSGDTYLFHNISELPTMIATVRDKDYYHMTAPSQFASFITEELGDTYEVIISCENKGGHYNLNRTNIKPIVEWLRKTFDGEPFDFRLYEYGFSWNHRYQTID